MSRSIYCGSRTGDCLPQDGRPSVSLITTAQDDEEGTSERLVQEGVEERVQPWIDVAQPQESCPQLPRHRVVYERVHYVCDKEGGPAQAEAPHDDAQGLGSFGLSLHAVRAVLVRVVLPAISGGPCTLEHPDLAGVLPGCDVDAVVGQHHQEEGNVEGHHGAGNGVWLVDHEYAVSGVGSLVELPLLNLGQEEEGQGQRRKFSTAPLIPAVCLPGHLTTAFQFSLLPPLSHPWYLPYPLLPLLPVLTPWVLQPCWSLGLQDQPTLQLWHPRACLNLASENQPNSPVQTQWRGVTSLSCFFAVLTALFIGVWFYTKDAQVSPCRAPQGY